MKPNIKKLLILNAPYLLFVWLFMKIGEAFRLSPGADLSGKLLHIMEGVTAAFESPMPSLNGQDFLVGIAGDDYPAELVKSKFMKLNSSHIQFVIDCMHQNTTKIRNIKKYLLAVLFNAPNTIDSYYTALVAHDMASGVFLSQDREDNTL